MIKPDSIKYQLLEMVGLCGEFPSGQLNRLIESDSYAEKVITDLKQSKLIRTHYKDGLRGYRLTKRAKELYMNIISIMHRLSLNFHEKIQPKDELSFSESIQVPFPFLCYYLLYYFLLL